MVRRRGSRRSRRVGRGLADAGVGGVTTGRARSVFSARGAPGGLQRVSHEVLPRMSGRAPNSPLSEPDASFLYISTVGVAELRENLSKYLRLVEQGERLVLTESNRPVAEFPSRSPARAA